MGSAWLISHFMYISDSSGKVSDYLELSVLCLVSQRCENIKMGHMEYKNS